MLNMNHCAIQQNSFVACDEIWASAAAGRSVEKKEAVVCPKPRRLGLTHTTFDPTYGRPLRWHVSHQQEDYDAKAGNELLDIIRAKGGSGSSSGLDRPVPQVASSPPFFSGSPPTRVSNPLIQDARFGVEKFTPVSPRAFPAPSGVAPSPSSTRKGGCVRSNFGNSPSAGGCVRSNFGNSPSVRIEGFDCLDRDRRNCSIPALA